MASVTNKMQNPNRGHPTEPRSNIAKVGSYDPDKYELVYPSQSFITSEALTPNRPPFLTQSSIGLYLKPLTLDLDEQPPRPTVAELPEAVIDTMVLKDKAFWVDKPGANAYVLTDAYYRYGMTTDQILPSPQAVFPRSYQYDLDCVKYRRWHACDGIDQSKQTNKKHMPPYCRDCQVLGILPASSSQQEPPQKRWRYYPDLTAKMTKTQIKSLMNEVGRPFQNEACNWYNKNYPSVKYNYIIRKFSK